MIAWLEHAAMNRDRPIGREPYETLAGELPTDARAV
jgi:hypothetical protein